MRRQQRHDNTESEAEEHEKAKILAYCDDDTLSVVVPFRMDSSLQPEISSCTMMSLVSFFCFILPLCPVCTSAALVTAVPRAFGYIRISFITLQFPLLACTSCTMSVVLAFFKNSWHFDSTGCTVLRE